MSDIPLYEDSLPGGAHWSLTLRRGMVLRLTDTEGGANVGMLFYNPINPLERYNAPDTLKCQQTFRLTAGNCLYSDMGRIFCSVIEDTFGSHDTVGGTTDAGMIEARYGKRTYQEFLNDWYQNGRTSFLIEAGKYGLGKRDLAMNVNWFSRLVTDDEGKLMFDAAAAIPGAHVDLRFEMDTLILFHTCPHPMNPANEYPRKGITYAVRQGEPVADDDLCRVSHPENGRGFVNTERYNAGLPAGAL